MKSTTLLSCASALALAAIAGGCGGGSTRTVSVSSSSPTSSAPAATTPAQTSTSKSQAHTSPAASQPSASTPAAASPSGGAAAPSSGSSSNEPAFVGQGSGAQGLDGAIALMRSRGYAALDPGQYRSDQTLKVLVGSREGSASHVQQAFFFVGGRYLGTDTSAPSAQIHVAGQNDTEVTLAYSLYHSRDAPCCPSGGQAQVRYQLDNGRLVALDPIPAIAATSASAGRQ